MDFLCPTNYTISTQMYLLQVSGGIRPAFVCLYLVDLDNQVSTGSSTQLQHVQ